MSQRYFLTTESAYEALRLALDADLGYPTSAATSIFTPALEAPRDSLRRIVLAVDDSLPHYAEIIAKVEPLLASASAQELTEAEYLAFLVCVSEGGGVPLAHAASHAVGGADELFDQDLNTDDNVEFARVEIAGWRLQEGTTPGDFWLAMPGYVGLFAFTTDGSMRFPDASTQTTAYTGKIGTTSGLVLKTGTDGAIEALAQGTAGQVLKVNSGATGVEWGDNPEEVVEYAATTNFPGTGNTSLLYIATDSSRLYRWTGSEYVEVGPVATYQGAFDMKVLHDTVSSTTYTGRAAPGSATSASVWKIRRTVYSGAGAVSSTATATNVKWDDRLTASYS